MKARFVVPLLAAGALLVPAATASAAAAPSGSTGRAVAKSPTEAVWCTFQGEKPFQVTHNGPLYAQGHYTGCSTPAPDKCRAQVDLQQYEYGGYWARGEAQGQRVDELQWALHHSAAHVRA